MHESRSYETLIIRKLHAIKIAPAHPLLTITRSPINSLYDERAAPVAIQPNPMKVHKIIMKKIR